MLRIALLLLVSGTLALVGPPTSQSSAQTTRSLTVTPDTGLVGGDVVTLAGTGFPASTVVDFCEGVITGQPPSSSDCGTTFESLTTDATGAFSVPVTVFRFITPSSSGTTIDCAASTAHCAIGAADVVTFEIVVTPITFTPQAAARFAIKGSVTGPDGHALANTDVWAYTVSDSWVGSLRTVTDRNGAYELDINPTGIYTVRFGPPAGTDLIAEWFDNRTHRRGAAGILLGTAFNDAVVTANAQLAAGGAIAGVVTDTAGAGVSGVTVWAYGPGDRWVGSFGATTAADGSYRINGVRPAAYRVRFAPPSGSGLAIQWFNNAPTAASATSVTVTVGSTATGIDAQLARSP
jgi:hypothetical protein